ncbi:MAG: tRNA pseudouridine synthase A [Bacteroidetes bacterium]|nr:MAG: tRNA pseudouridine synthase A [Bacteroidota bacterium]
MQTIRLQVNNSAYKHLMQFLSKFNKEELQIINEDQEFLSVQNYLQNELVSIEQGNAEFISLNQLDAELEDTIQKYEG